LKVLKEKSALLLLIIVIVLAQTAFVGCQPQAADKQSEQPQKDASEAVITPQPQEQIPEDLEGFTEYTIKKQVGEKNNIGKDKIKKITVEGSEKERIVIIELNANDSFSADLTIRGMLMDSKKILEPLSKRQDVSGVSVAEYLDVEDIDGSKTEEWVYTLILDRKGLDKVIEGDYLLDELPKLAKEYKVHPNFNGGIK
jgi:hypothetical protein